MTSILFVDDEPSMLDVGKIFLEENAGYSVQCAISGKDAIDLMAAGKYDAIVADYQMPGMDGITLLKKVRETNKTLPYILFTGRGREEVAIEAINEGADFYLQKGGSARVQFAELAHKIRIAVERRAAEAALKESEALNRKILENLPDYVLVYGHDGEILYANSASAEVLGYRVEELIGKSVISFVTREYQAKAIAKLASRRNENDTSLYEIEIKGKGNIRRRVIVKGTPIQYGDSHAVLLVLIDITDRDRAEAALRESESRLRSLIGSMNDLVFVLDKDLVFREYYQQNTDALFIRPELFLGRHLDEIGFPEPALGIMKNALTQTLQTGTPSMAEYYLDMQNGRSWFDIHITSFESSDGTRTGLTCVVRDITGRKQVEETLAESEERFRMLLQHVPSIAIQGYTLDGITHYWNEASEKLYGYTAEEAIGKNLLDLIIPPEMRDDVRKAIAYMAETGQPIPASELFLMRKDRSLVEVFSHHALVKRPRSGLELFCIDIDLSQRKQAEEALKQSETSYRGLFNTIRQAIYILNEDGTFLDVNEGAEAMYGYAREEFIGKTPEFLSAPGKNDFPAVVDYLHKAFAGEPQVFEFWGLRKNKEIFPKDVRLYKGTYFGKEVIIAIGTDISERKQVEDALRLVNRKHNLLTGITRHEINNHLIALDGYITILEKKAKEPALEAYFQKSAFSLKRIASMIKFTKKYEKIGINAPLWYDIGELVGKEGTQAMLGRIQLNNDIPAGTEILADPLISIVINNLMDNAVRYGEKITTLHVALHGLDGDRTIIFEDDGAGVPVDEKEKIFEFGYGKNTGMGLFLAREILDITGISIRETGEPGKGARFEVMIPKGIWRKGEGKTEGS